MNIVITIFASIYVLFLPGFVVSFVFFKKGAIDLIERIALSFALSISIVPLVVFYTNLIGIRINTLSVILQIAGILGIAGIVLFVQRKRENRHSEG